MKHIVTLIQVLFFIVMDTILFLWCFKWNCYLTKYGHSFKKKNGIVSYINNNERNVQRMNHYPNKYKAAFKL